MEKRRTAMSLVECGEIEDDGAVTDPGDRTVNQQIGEQVRRVRRGKGMSLQQVETMTEFRFKASVLGAYERGERAMTVARVVALAKEYGLPVGHLLPAFVTGVDPSVNCPQVKLVIEGDIGLTVMRDGESRQVIRG